MDANRRHKTPGSEIKDFIIYGMGRIMCISIFVLVTLYPKSCRGNAMGSDGCYAFSGLILQLTNTEFGGSTAFVARSDVYIYYLACDDSFTGAHIYQNISDSVL